VHFQVLFDHGLQRRVQVHAQDLLLHQDVPERLAFFEHPGVHAGHELIAADEIHLQGQDGEQQIAVGGVGHGGRLQQVWELPQYLPKRARSTKSSSTIPHLSGDFAGSLATSDPYLSNSGAPKSPLAHRGLA